MKSAVLPVRSINGAVPTSLRTAEDRLFLSWSISNCIPCKQYWGFCSECHESSTNDWIARLSPILKTAPGLAGESCQREMPSPRLRPRPSRNSSSTAPSGSYSGLRFMTGKRAIIVARRKPTQTKTTSCRQHGPYRGVPESPVTGKPHGKALADQCKVSSRPPTCRFRTRASKAMPRWMSLRCNRKRNREVRSLGWLTPG